MSARALPSRELARIAVAAIAAIVAVAAATRLVDPVGARAQLRYGFGGVPATFDEALLIFWHNTKVLSSVFALAGVVQAIRAGGVGVRLLSGYCDVLLLGLAAGNVITIGTAIGAYGDRVLAFMLPHGPVELSAFAVALALYIEARRGPLALRRAGPFAATAVALLAAAAMLETFGGGPW